AELLWKEEIIKTVAESEDKAAAKKRACYLLGISRRSVENMVRRWEEDRLAGFLRKTRKDRGSSRAAYNELIPRIQFEYLKPHQPTIADVHRLIVRVCEMNNRPAPSDSFVKLVVRGIAPDLIARMRKGDKT